MQILPSELIEVIAMSCDFCTAVSFRLTCLRFFTLPLVVDKELKQKIEQFRNLLTRKWPSFPQKLLVRQFCALMGYVDLFHELRSDSYTKQDFLTAGAGDCLAITSCVYERNLDMAVLICVAFNSETVYRELLSNYQGSEHLIEIYASGRPWLNSYYKNPSHQNKTTYKYALHYGNCQLIRATLPKRVTWKEAICVKQVRDTDPVLYNWFLNAIYHRNLRLYVVIRLDDVPFLLRWISNKEEIDTSALVRCAIAHKAYSILRCLNSK